MPKGELGRRLAVAAVGIPIALTLIYLGGWALGVLMSVAAAVGAAEYYSLARAGGVRPLGWIGIPAAAAFPILATLYPSYRDFSEPAMTLVLVLLLLSMAAVLWMRWPDGTPMAAAASTVTGALYTGGMLAFWVLLRHLPETASDTATAANGTALVLFPITITWVGDTFAYFFGTRFGKTKLLEAVSPKKTVLGGHAGLVGAMLTAGIFGFFWLQDVPGYEVSWIWAVGLGLVLGALGQVGDLTESVLKRESGVKDSGAILPGHGGVLDRLDALYFTVPVAFLIFLWIARIG
jgi:phosphatidate cytidylyltransferase